MLNHIVSEIEKDEDDKRSKREARLTSDGYLKTGLNSVKESLIFISKEEAAMRFSMKNN